MQLPIILTLDAGGTNLVFSAYQGREKLCESVNLKTSHKCLDSSLDQIISGFAIVQNQINEKLRQSALPFQVQQITSKVSLAIFQTCLFTEGELPSERY